MRTLRIASAVVLAWFIRTAAAPLAGSAADLVWLVPAASLWLSGRHQAAWWFAMGVALLIDLAQPAAVPATLVATLLAGATYEAVVLPRFAQGSLPNRALVVTLWLAGWRLARWFVLWLSWVGGRSVIPPSELNSFRAVAWLVLGFACWFVYERARAYRERRLGGQL